MPDPVPSSVIAHVSGVLAQAGLEHGPLKVVSTTNHVVLTDTHCFFKTPLPASPSPGAIEVEALVLDELALMPVATITASDGLPVMITPAMGTPLAHITPAAVTQATELLAAVHARAIPASLAGLPDMGGVLRALPGRMRRRLDQASLSTPVEGLVTDWISQSFQSLSTPPPGTVVLHGDPHPGNWVGGLDDHVVLVDWESARLGPPEWDLATLAHSFLLAGRLDLWAQALEVFGPVDVGAFTWCFALKATTATSWAAWQLGDEGVLERQAMIWPHVSDPRSLLDVRAELTAPAAS